MATIPLIINGYDKTMGERIGDTIKFMHPGVSTITKVEQKTDKGYIELTLGARIGIGPHGSTYFVEQWQSSGTINLGDITGTTKPVTITPPDWVKHYSEPVKFVAVGSAVGCPHQWEQKPLFTGYYHKCLMCGKEKT
jgi:hypothetical protein